MEEKNKDILAGGQQETMLFQDACQIIEQAQAAAYRAVDVTLIKRNWLLGLRIQHEVLKDKRAEYGEQVVANLAEKLTEKYGKGFIKRNLHHFVDFYIKHPDFFYAVSGKSDISPSVMGQSDSLEIVNAVSSKLPIATNNIVNAVSSQSSVTQIFQSLTGKYPIRLTWTHYRIILQESSKEAREWYEEEAAREMWGTRTLQRNVSSQYYHRLLQSQNKDAVRGEMKQLTAPLQDKLEYIKNPVVAEFLGFKNRTDYTESELEQTIIDHLIPFLMELGKGFALVDRQKRIHTEKDDYYIDMVFYNYNLRSFVLIDLLCCAQHKRSYVA